MSARDDLAVAGGASEEEDASDARAQWPMFCLEQFVGVSSRIFPEILLPDRQKPEGERQVFEKKDG